MHVTKVTHGIALTGICVLLLAGCTMDVADTGSGVGTGNPAVAGTVYTREGKPAAGAKAVLRRADFLKDTSLSVMPEVMIDSNEVVLSTDGTFRFDSLDTGAYFIEVTLGETSAVLLECDVSNNDTCVQIPEASLLPPGTITGTISLHGGPIANRYAQVYGLNKVVKANTDGSFEISVPEGEYTLRIVLGKSEYLPVEIAKVTDESVNLKVSILSENPISTNFTCDSLIIRAILDINNLQTISVDSINELEDGRVKELKFIGSGYSVLPGLIGGLNTLKEIYLQNTTVSSLPARIGELVNMEELKLNNNQLTTLPGEIANLTKIKELDLSYNHLKNLPIAAKTWADTYDSDWKSTQDTNRTIRQFF